MEKLLIEGKHSLYGEVNISGMKNSALPILYACLLIKEECIVHNVPRVSDIFNTIAILQGLGAQAEFIEKNTVRINAKNATSIIKNQDLVLSDAINKCMEIISDLTNYASIVLGSQAEDNLLKQVSVIQNHWKMKLFTHFRQLFLNVGKRRDLCLCLFNVETCGVV